MTVKRKALIQRLWGEFYGNSAGTVTTITVITAEWQWQMRKCRSNGETVIK